ncbi:hypothetical protein UNDYM_0548 [Undibacterium sp. YM2]|uniref:hypothetical protein n=1 Tax=Undibacterium sp. YM2 TaxID=2058625 RepID=UPI001331DFC7|nr:hypothetical protein [Undibacterium sp. YM2]BBB64801.1 hypothetical protein UNDYM_0548 [Undibacterium sp. YM2]
MNTSDRKQRKPAHAVKLTTCISLLATACLCPLAQAQILPPDAKPTCTTSTPANPGGPAPIPFAQWFEPAGVTNGGLVKAADSVNFADASACSFYQWSHQMFLWLTSPTPKGLSGGDHIFSSSAFYGVSPAANGARNFIPQLTRQAMNFSPLLRQLGPNNLPVAFDKSGKLFEVLPPKLAPSGKATTIDKAGKTVEIDHVEVGAAGKVNLLAKGGKQIETDLVANLRARLPKKQTALLTTASTDSNIVQSFKREAKGGLIYLDAAGNEVDMTIGQAGGSNVLVAQNGSLVYYSIAANDLFAYFLTQRKPNAPANLMFPTTAQELADVVAYAKKAGLRDLAAPEALAVEVKLAWIETTGFDEATKKKFIIIDAEIPDVSINQPASLKQGAVKNKKTKLALVGVHVVGSAKGNPELIWATFEHMDNTPNAEYKYIDVNGAEKLVPQNTKGKWLFSQDGATGPFNQALYKASGNSITCTDTTKPCVVKPNDTIRWKPWGAAADQNPRQADPTHAGPVITPPESNTDLLSINNSVISQLAPGDVRKNYLMIGSTWTTGGRAPDSDKPPATAINQVGTSRLANTTMETVHQGSNINWAGGTNCFRCHTSNTVTVSHIWNELNPLPKTQVKAKTK